ncbi:MAG: hypothetical protein DA408_19670 [Bacteroidetes bacterium]|nr:MAG: hypothetical protein C7N36_08090 [Bacteroidota bacterium]PTM08878.1 MAG: hypothetical protein DA408_19670 [Bacteroidota bacterium]
MWNREPVRWRRDIPLFVDKSPADFQADPYERYREVVTRQMLLHLADAYWGGYPFQVVPDWLLPRLPVAPTGVLVDVGCGLGRLLAEIATHRPGWSLLGMDYSYNLLRTAHELWQQGATVNIDYRDRGFPLLSFQGKALPQLQLGLARANHLPLADGGVDTVVSTFLLDRLDHPAAALQEWQRILRPGGRLYLVSPLNWQNAENWTAFAEPGAVVEHLSEHHWTVLDQTEFLLEEPLDVRGNKVVWKVLALVAQVKL